MISSQFGEVFDEESDHHQMMATAQLDMLHGMAGRVLRNRRVRDAAAKATAAGIPWVTIITTILSILAGGGGIQAIIDAILALIKPK